MFKQIANKFFPSQNDKNLRRLRKTIVAQTNALESDVEPLSDDQIRERYNALRERFQKEAEAQTKGKKLEHKEISKIERPSRMSGRRMTLLLVPK